MGAERLISRALGSAVKWWSGRSERVASGYERNLERRVVQFESRFSATTFDSHARSFTLEFRSPIMTRGRTKTCR